MNILISSAGSTNGVNVIKALKGFNLVACDCEKLSAGLYMVKKRYVVPRADDVKFIPKILSICKKEKIGIVIPTFSKELYILAKNKELFKKKGVKMAVSESYIYEWTENKIKCNSWLEELGFSIPNQNPKKFPMIVKPICGSGTKNTYKVNNKKELDFYKNDTNFYEEFIEGTEYTIDGMCDLYGNMICALPRIRIEKKGGLATKCKTVKNDYLVEIVKDMIERLEIIGAFNVQCIEREGKFYFIDINNRFPSGGLPLAVASGMNMPKMIIDLLNYKEVKPKLIYGKTLIRYYDGIVI